MKTNIIKRIVWLLLLLPMAACTKHRVIPDEELAMIFRDAFLTNAYVSARSLTSDSLNFYQPIFEQYGYTVEDVERTIENFSKRKSARLSDVVERAIVLLDEQGGYYEREVAVLDTIASVSSRSLYRTVYADSLIRARRLADSTLLHIELDSLKPGRYRISADYRVDSADRNVGLRGGVWTLRENGARRNTYTFLLRREIDASFTRTVSVDSAQRKLVVSFAEFPGKRQPLSVTVRNLKIEYTLPDEEAIDSFFHRQVDVRIFADEFLNHVRAKDSL